MHLFEGDLPDPDFLDESSEPSHDDTAEPSQDDHAGAAAPIDARMASPP